jgi:hypothetical protein
VHNRIETLDQYWFTCRRNPTGLRWGVCTVECSTAGRFFRHLPRVTEVVSSLDCVDACLASVKRRVTARTDGSVEIIIIIIIIYIVLLLFFYLLLFINY